jgi:hypothetical protein
MRLPAQRCGRLTSAHPGLHRRIWHGVRSSAMTRAALFIDYSIWGPK